MIRRPPRSTRTDTLFPYTTLFRSVRLFDAVIFNDGVGEQFLAHGFYVGIAGPVCKVQFDELASANVIYATKAKPFQRMVDGLSLRVQDAAFPCHANAGFHIGRLPELRSEESRVGKEVVSRCR